MVEVTVLHTKQSYGKCMVTKHVSVEIIQNMQ